MSKQKGNHRFSLEIQDRIIQVLAGGNYRAAAAKAVNISEKTLSHWCNSPEKKFAEFQRKVQEVEAEVEIRAVRAICDAGDKDARWWAWFLERKFPKRWNSGVHKWEVQVLQKQVKELQRMVATMANEASQSIENDEPLLETPETNPAPEQQGQSS